MAFNRVTNASAGAMSDDLWNEQVRSGKIRKADSTMMEGKAPWTGSEKILIAIDCGTTFSGVAYAYLIPNGRWNIQRVVEWPGQGAQKGEAKIPTIIWYDQNGNAQAFGAEAASPSVRAKAKGKGWRLAEHFKLHLHPVTMAKEGNIQVTDLPTGVPLDKIYADFLGYLYAYTGDFFRKREIDGSSLWNRLKDDIEFVIAHPNGWDAYEQDFLRKAAVKGGLVSQESAGTKVHFVTEGEASVHFVMAHGDAERRLEPGHDFIVCDAGGSTVDTTLYTVTQTKPTLELKEKRASACVQAGAIFVNLSAKEHFEGLFSSANLDSEEIQDYVEEAVESFETEAKRKFSGLPGEEIIKVGGHRFTDRSIGVRRGMMTLDNNMISKFFLPWTTQIIQSVNHQMKGHSSRTILLVGGFGDSPFLRRQFKDDSTLGSLELTLANEPTAKAVADGAALWYITRSVTARAARFSFGIAIRKKHMSWNSNHKGRKTYTDTSGTWVKHVWDPIVKKDEVLRNDEDRRNEYNHTYFTENPTLSNVEVDLYAYTEAKAAPYFVTENDYLFMGLNEGFTKACTIEADMSQARSALTEHTGTDGSYWTIDFKIAIFFGRTELSAGLIWEDAAGTEYQGTATVIPKRFV